MNVSLIHAPPSSEFDRHWARFPVLGLAYLAAAARRAGHRIDILDGKLGGLSAQEIVLKVLEIKPDLVGLTCMTVEFPIVAKIASEIRQYLDIPIVIGGAHVNAVGPQALQECAAIDFACVGEGEFTFVELLDSIEKRRPVDSIAGLCFRRNGQVIKAATRPYPANYDGLPFPAWDLFALGDQIPILTHRGCPYQCTFCGHNSGFKARFRSVDNVLSELSDSIDSYAPKVIRFEDETFGLDMQRTKAILNGIIEKGLHQRVTFSAQTRVDRADKNFVTLLRLANFEFLELGVESGNARILRDIRKGITLEQVDSAVMLAKEVGLSVWCKFILGHPNETSSSIRDTVRYIAKLNPERLSVSLMTPYPGTPIHEMALRGEGGYRLLSRDWKDYDKYSTGALELENLPLYMLKVYQLLCYLWLYCSNGRTRELMTLIGNHRAMAWEMLLGPLRSIWAHWKLPMFSMKRM